MESRNNIKIFLFLIFLLFGSRVSAQTLTLKQGEILFYPINFKGNLTSYFGGVKIPIFEYSGQNYTLVAADVSKIPGNYNLRIRSGKNGEQELEKKVIQVKVGNYEKVVKRVPYKFVTLSKEKQAIVVKDKAPLLALLTNAATVTSPRLWKSIFRSPLDKSEVTSSFGYKRIYTNYSTIHQGVDLRAKIGTPIYAIGDGKVLWGEEKSLYLEGPTVAIDHGDGIVSKYLHLSKVLVKSGDMISAGDIIGYSGDQGADVTGPHLHFAIKIKNASVNPLQFLSEFQKLKNLNDKKIP